MNHAATTASQVPCSSRASFVFVRAAASYRFNASLNASARRSERQVEELDPFRDQRLSRERLSNGLSLRFAYGWVRKSVSRERGGRCRRSTWSGEETTGPRIIAAFARSSRADNVKRRTITPIEILGYRISSVASIPFYCLSTVTAVKPTE